MCIYIYIYIFTYISLWGLGFQALSLESHVETLGPNLDQLEVFEVSSGFHLDVPGTGESKVIIKSKGLQALIQISTVDPRIQVGIQWIHGFQLRNQGPTKKCTHDLPMQGAGPMGGRGPWELCKF